MKKLLITVFWGLALALPVRGQSPDSLALPAWARPGPGRADTARAVGRLYARKRAGAWGWDCLAVGSLVGLLANLMGVDPWRPGPPSPPPGGRMDPASAAGLGGLFVVAPAALSLTQHRHFSRHEQNAVLQHYLNGWPLPPRVKRRLRPKDFREAAD